MNSRRGFIRSSVTSFLLGPSLLKPARGIRNGKPEKVYAKAQAVARLLLDPIERLEKYKLVLATEGGKYFRGPAIQKVEIKDSVIRFDSEPCVIQERFQEKLVLELYSPEGDYRISRPFTEVIPLNPGDSLRVTYYIGFSGLC